jgi:biotin carboxylase
LVFIDTTGPGIQALEYARAQGHTSTLVCSQTYDFYLSPEQRRQARSAADQCVEVNDPRETDVVLDALTKVGVTPGQADAMLTTLHSAALPAARLARQYGVLGAAPEAIMLALDKGLCRQAVSDYGLPNLRFRVVSTAQEAAVAAAQIGYPVIVKPVRGLGKVVTRVASSPQDLEEHFAVADQLSAALTAGLATELDHRFIIEEIAVGDLVSVEVGADGRTITPLAVVRRKTGRDNPVLELGSTVPSRLGVAAEQELGDYAVSVCRALGLDFGVFHVELMHTVDGPRLVEVNPRIAGGAIPDLVRAATGNSLFATLVDLSLGAAVPSQPWPAVAGASHSFLAAADDTVVRADLPRGWFDALRPRIHSGWTSIGPGAQLRRMDGNFDVYGVVRIVAGNAADAERECADMVAEIAGTLNIRFPLMAAARLEG